MLKPVLFSVAFGATCYASNAAAENYTIIFEHGGFFPEITYLQPGDTATFINETDAAVTAEATDQSWSTGSLEQFANFVLPVAEDTILSFTVAEDETIEGYLSFMEAPLSEMATVAVSGDDIPIAID